MKSRLHPRSSNDPAPPSAEARSAFDEIVSDIVAGPLSSVHGELQALADEFRTADEEALRELKGSTRRALSEYIGNPGVGPAATLFGLIGDPDEGTLANQLDRISDQVGDTAAAGSQDHERMEALVRDAVQCMAQHDGDLRAWLADQRDAHEASTALQLRETSAARADVRDLMSAQSHALDQLGTQQQQDLAQAIEAITAAADSIRRDLSTTTADVTSAAQERSELAQQSANALSTKIHRLTILVILQWVALTALMLVR